jgi:Uma2 family endonuclease
MGMPAETRRWTAADVRELQDESRAYPRYELIAGELLVTPSPRTSHQYAVSFLLTALSTYVDAEHLGVALVSPADIELEPGNITQPDVFVVPATGRPFREWTDVKALLVAVEVLSPGNAEYDRGTKRLYYQRTGVPEYWVVDLDTRAVERWRPNDDRPEFVRGTLEWSPDRARTAFTLDLPAFFARVLGDDIAAG